MKLTKKQIELVNTESKMSRIFDENHVLPISKKLWNKYRIMAKIYYKNGDFWKAEKV